MAKIKNRIVGSGEEQLDQIMFNPRNWRIHPLSQQDALKGVLEEVGWVQQVIVNKRTGNLIDGHLRCQLAAREGAKTIPVVYVDVSEDEEALVLATLDPIGAMAATDKQKLDELFQDINSDNENVQKMIAEIAEKEGVLGDLPTLDDLESKFGEPNERDFWPIVRVQVSPDTFAKFTALMASTPGADEAEKFDAIISGSL
ncbi:MAG: ParB N-terminal domain-containing protein [Thermotogaceae bacterium]|nr:ParB N-terminal domain-containing protein [Thermotogaceae bacterium]